MEIKTSTWGCKQYSHGRSVGFFVAFVSLLTSTLAEVCRAATFNPLRATTVHRGAFDRMSGSAGWLRCVEEVAVLVRTPYISSAVSLESALLLPALRGECGAR